MSHHDHLHQNTQIRKRAVHVAIAASVSVAIIELILGYLLHLESLLAEGIHTLLDGVDSIIVLVTIYLAARPADRQHPFGYGKYEALGAGVEGLFVLGAGIGIAWRAIDRLVSGEAPPSIPLYVCACMMAAAVFYYVVSLYLMRIAKESGSPAIYAEAMHLRTHIYITGGLGAGLLIGALGNWPIVDTLLALGVAACLLGIARQVLRQVWNQMMDVSLPREEVRRLSELLEPFGSRFVEIHGLRTRQAGVERHIEMHLVVQPETTVRAAHDLSHEIEDAILTEWPAAHVTVHIEPLNTSHDEHREWTQDQPKVRTDDDSPTDREFMH
ncbi:MAG TPA: cation diffusion facilitator family transporter [Phycisphaerae bacterium]|nr:cation diffusion facilitator family transporter [Phycisphaerae bacterium]